MVNILKQNLYKASKLFNDKRVYYGDYLQKIFKYYQYDSIIKYNNFKNLRLVNSGNLVETPTTIDIDINNHFQTALLNLEMINMFPNKKNIDIYYPYLHKKEEDISPFLTKNIIKKIDKKIKYYKKRYKIDNLNYKIDEIDKYFVSSTGSFIVQKTILSNIDINSNYYKYKDIIPIKKISDIKFPKFKKYRYSFDLDQKDIILSPQFVAKLFLYLNSYDMLPDWFNGKISPYLNGGIQNNLYDDEGSLRSIGQYDKLKYGTIFQKFGFGNRFYNPKFLKYCFSPPDIRLSSGVGDIKKYYKNCIVLDMVDDLKIENNIALFYANYNFYKNGKYLGTLRRDGNIKLNFLSFSKSLLGSSKVISIDNFSVKAPYIDVGNNES